MRLFLHNILLPPPVYGPTTVAFKLSVSCRFSVVLVDGQVPDPVLYEDTPGLLLAGGLHGLPYHVAFAQADTIFNVPGGLTSCVLVTASEYVPDVVYQTTYVPSGGGGAPPPTGV